MTEALSPTVGVSNKFVVVWIVSIVEALVVILDETLGACCKIYHVNEVNM